MDTPVQTPPRILSRLLKTLITAEIRSGAMGDFNELFSWIAHNRSRLTAHLWYSFQILQLIPGYLKRSASRNVNMLKNHLKTTLRNMKRSKGYTFINVAGLAVGIACCILILLYIQYELGFDRFHENAGRIYLLKRHGL